MDQGKPDHQSSLGILGKCCQDPPLGRNQYLPITGLGKAEVKSPLTITEISKVIGASLLTKRDIREPLNVPEPLTQNQNVNELKLDF